jgi:hypothetical protein
LINEYLDEVTVPYFRQLAGDLLDRMRGEEEPAT